MKNRAVLYGYRYETGRLIRNEQEVWILLRICGQYLDGQSLQSIADELNAEQVLYQPGVIGWNKSRLIRLLTDERYTGAKGYPSIWSAETNTRICSLRDGKNTQRNLDRSRGRYLLSEPVVCAECGKLLHRQKSHSKADCDLWYCPDCGFRLTLEDDCLPTAVTEILNLLIAHPERIQWIQETQDCYEPSNAVKAEESAIRYEIATHSIARADCLARIRASVSAKYAELPSTQAILNRMKADLSQTGLLSAYSKVLSNRIVDRILLHRDGSVQLRLANGQTVGREAT